MGRDLAEKYPIARQTFEEADEALGYKLSQLCFEGPEEQLRLTEITQPAILTVSVAALRVLEGRIPRPSFVAGHSLGEYSAHVASGTMSFADAVRTVRNRGKYMQEAVPVGVGAMAAILGMELEKVDRGLPGCGAGRSLLAREHQFAGADCDLRQHRGGGARSEAGRRARREAREVAAGERALPLFADEARARPPRSGLECARRCRSRCTPWSATWKHRLVTDDLRARETLVGQVTGSVKWEQCMRLLIENGVQTFRGDRAGKSSVRVDAADRPVEDLLECWRRGIAGEGAGAVRKLIAQ